LFFGETLLGLYTQDPEVIKFGMIRLTVIMSTYITAGMMDVMSNELRAVGYSLAPVIIAIVGVCGFRVVWIYTVFARTRSLKILYASYPISWTVTLIAEFIVFIMFWRKLRKRESYANSSNA